LEIYDIRQIDSKETKIWFAIRIVGNFLSFLAYLGSISYLRLSTASCINSSYPVVCAFVSIVALKEKFFMRYIYGLLLCLISTIIISMNEKKLDIHAYGQEEYVDYKIIVGTLLGFVGVIFRGLFVVAAKVLSKEGINSENQSLYVGITNTIFGIFFAALFKSFTFSVGFCLYSAFGGIFWYLASLWQVKAMDILGVAKTTPIGFLGTISLFVFGVIIFAEPLFFTDLLARLVILGFIVYHTMNPLK